MKRSLKSISIILLDFFEFSLIGAVVFMIVYVLVGQLMEVSGDSMLPNFHNKEQVIAETVSTKMGKIQRGEVVIFKHPSEPGKLLIKRVIGLPNETIKISSGSIYINNSQLSEKYLSNGIKTKGKASIQNDMEYKIASNAFIVLGDNRPNSSDSRDFGAVPAENVMGRPLLVWYPLKDIKLIQVAQY